MHTALVEEGLPRALQAAAADNKELRRTLPRDLFEAVGQLHDIDDLVPGEREDKCVR